MPLDLEDEIVGKLADRLAELTHVTRREAIKVALENELARVDKTRPLRERLKPLQERVLSRPPTGLDADKAFYDSLYEEN